MITHAPSLADAAIRLGLPVFPCAGDKRPLPGTHGFQDATTDPAIIRSMFAQPDAALIGVPAGEASGVVVVDVDVRDGAEGGAWLTANEWRIPPTRRHRTGSGGTHLVFQMPDVPVRNSASRIAPGVDVRGTGGYVIWPAGSPLYSVLDSRDPAPVPDWLLPLLAPPAAPAAPPAPRRECPTDGGTPYGLRALEGECETIRTAGFGGQEHTLNAAGLKIGALVAGGELEEGVALAELLAAARGMPSQPGRAPWSQRELEDKARRAFRDGQRRPRAAPERPAEPEAESLENHPAAPFLAKHMARAYAQMGKAMSKPPPVSAGIMDVDGALRMLVDECNRTAIRPQPFLALGAAICAVGALAGRRYRTQTNLRTNMYVAAIAESGGGKDHAAEVVREAIAAAGLKQYLGGENITSGRAILTSLEQHPARLFAIDEFGVFLKTITGEKAASHKAELRGEFLKIYSRAKGVYLGTEYANQKENARVDLHQPHACVYGTTTPSTFWGALEGGAMHDGLLARFLIFAAEDNKPPRNKGKKFFEPDAGGPLSEALRAIARGADGWDHGGNLAELMKADIAITPYTVPMTTEADALHDRMWDEVEDVEARKAEGTGMASIINRMAENAAKLALVRAVGRDPARPVIGLVDVEWGWALSRHCIHTLQREADAHMADSAFQQKCNKLLNMLRKRGPMSAREMFNSGLRMPDKERDELLRSLEGAGQIRALPHATGAKGGRPTTRWVASGASDGGEGIDPETGEILDDAA